MRQKTKKNHKKTLTRCPINILNEEIPAHLNNNTSIALKFKNNEHLYDVGLDLLF